MRFPDLPTDQDTEADEIAFHYEDVPSPFADELPYCRWLADVADDEERPLLTLTYIFCSDEYLLRVNREYLQHDFYTDVITFPYTEPEEGIHGDVFISTERVAENAGELGVPFERELARVMVHGLLHLAGYGDKTKEEQRRMREKEDHYLSQLDVG
ncbi:MAG: rRNA maturation RNase YbeY [Saprospiraceae bacterium]|nr:rRNA maturation RNase YbeY [Saprospiraceae bacterium]